MDRKTAAILAVCGVGLIAGWGPLDPPDGPITSTYKTLTEVEPRTAVNAENTPGDATSIFKLTKSGSYYLTGNVKGASGKSGILIAASRVALDLGGFSLEGVTGSVDGVKLISSTGVTVRNGTIFNWDHNGVMAAGTTACRFESIVSYSNTERGFELGADSIAVDCAAGTSGTGFWAEETGTTLRDCTASENFGYGFILGGSVAIGCTARKNADDNFYAERAAVLTDCTSTDSDESGYYLSQQSRATRCAARGNYDGFLLFDASTIVECTGADNASDGASVWGNSNSIERCTFSSNAHYGISVLGQARGNSIDGNLCMYNTGTGISIAEADNLIVRNRARGNGGDEYLFDVGCDYGVILTNPGQGFTSSAAWANFAY